MAETKEAIAAERDRLRRENEQLRGQLAAAGAGRPNTTTAQFELTEGNRQDLLARGETVIAGRRYTRDQVESAIEGNPDYDRVDLGDTEPAAQPGTRAQGDIPGVDFVYPSVLAGRIDPAVAGTPGINGPAATDEEMRRVEQPAAEDPAPPIATPTDDDDAF